MAAPSKSRLEARSDLAWSIAMGGMAAVGFAAFVVFAWYFAATLFLIFAGILLGVALNAMTNLIGRVLPIPHSLRLAMVCVLLARRKSIDAFADLMRPLGLREIARTGVAALSRGA